MWCSRGLAVLSVAGITQVTMSQPAGVGTSDHPLLATSSCPARLWQPNEVPQIHEVNVVLDPADFQFMLRHQAAQYDDPNARDMNVTTIYFDGEAFNGGKFKVHGGKYQRGGSHWEGEPGRDGQIDSDTSLNGGDCYRKDNPTAEGFTCKPSFRLKFSKHAPYNGVFDTLFRYPADKQGCNNPRKFTLNGNWNDPAHIRSKITQDLVIAAGGLAPRIEYARLSVNGQFFGMYSIEESIKEFWASCFGIDTNANAAPGTYPQDPLEVAKTAILKNDHGTCGGWPANPEENCADGFERKAPACDGCDNDFVMRNNPQDFPDCECDNLPQLQHLFQTINVGSKDEVAAAINMTSVFIYQSSVAIIGNTDTGTHNYYMSKQPGQPWRIINADPDWSWGHCLGGGRGGNDRISSTGAPCVADKCMALPWRGGGDEPVPSRWCCGDGPACADGFTLVDGEGTPGAQECFGGRTSICCFDPNWDGVPPPPPTADELIVKNFEGSCPFAADGIGSLHGAQSNEFLRKHGPVQELFEEDYVRFLDTLLRMPEWQPCAIEDAAAVLLDAEHGVIRAAYDEDRSYWTRDGNADEQLEFFQAWTRLRLAAVKQVVSEAMAELTPPQVQLTACGMAQPGEVGDLCSATQLAQGKCFQGTLFPQCLPAAEAGYDDCACPPGYGWSSAAEACKPAATTSAEEAQRCLTVETSGGSVIATGAGKIDDSSGAWVGVTATLLVVGVVGTALMTPRIRSAIKPKTATAEGIYEEGEHGNSIADDVGVGASDIVLETTGNPSATTV
jgi:spore coat protein CotH